MAVLGQDEWGGRAAAHRVRAEAYTAPARARRGRGEKHPIEDFLFEYYTFPLAHLEKWHPGFSVGLECGEGEMEGLPCGREYALEGGVWAADAARMRPNERPRLAWMADLLEATRDRAGNFACHGLHEWAMVYRGREVRHERTLGLRLAQAEVDAVVQGRAICCSHFDAFRFFAPEARGFNVLQPSMGGRVAMEQPACLHANMDLYKWAAKTVVWCGSELMLECFELAMRLRDLDMRASPYDLSGWGREAVKIETPEGRRQYEEEQRALASEAVPLRQRLIDALRRVLAA